MKALYIPSPRQLVKQFVESDFYEDPDVIKDIVNCQEQCPISKSIKEFQDWIENQVVTRNIDTLWLHATGTLPNVSWSAILRYWREALEWLNPGYGIGISANGWTALQDLQYPTNGVRGFNARGIHLATTSGLDKNGKIVDNRNTFQQTFTHSAVQIILRKWPHLKVRPHYAVSNKACPVFNFEKEFSYLFSPPWNVPK